MKTSSPLSLPYPTLCLVTDPGYTQAQPMAAVVAAAIEGGVNLVQLRDKNIPAGHLLAQAKVIRNVTRDNHALFLINDRVDIALAASADGVQLGEEGLPVEVARQASGNRLLVGRSVHSLRGAHEAEAQGADFLLVGTIFPTGSKPEVSPVGLNLLAHIRQSVRIPFLAIGGITSCNVAQVMAHGAAGVAVISAILGPSDTCHAAGILREAMISSSQMKAIISR